MAAAIPARLIEHCTNKALHARTRAILFLLRRCELTFKGRVIQSCQVVAIGGVYMPHQVVAQLMAKNEGHLIFPPELSTKRKVINQHSIAYAIGIGHRVAAD